MLWYSCTILLLYWFFWDVIFIIYFYCTIILLYHNTWRIIIFQFISKLLCSLCSSLIQRQPCRRRIPFLTCLILTLSTFKYFRSCSSLPFIMQHAYYHLHHLHHSSSVFIPLLLPERRVKLHQLISINITSRLSKNFLQLHWQFLVLRRNHIKLQDFIYF